LFADDAGGCEDEAPDGSPDASPVSSPFGE
jgi:hypothetical protein